ncbi:50S ribosomal protein L3 [Helicobacter pylori]|uniref:50S ribosomal protein L3 n=1 Tax=Helicobacter pylori (strain 51) TaxID=290847 RepID=A0AAI8F133_HELP1|nr:50S ribosomal protein L3 [Helicobacter pylori]ACX98404.1 ribosomal protein L3 [Helicobacter pylori 51]WQY23755.1 50S ribosomal protein L3 [Helicobacter pylori]WRB50064.1 50S ribosomal protein L3 [Helicobacter pylori]WRE62778.1 50S ribosomal protein L3 [Helicobacter pylori]WRF11266.1 50S ribosomal protein L3 [Helicobacter pylori]
MEFLVQKIGMSRTIDANSTPVTLLKVLQAKVCQLENGKALVAYAMHKKYNKAIEGQQKKYQLSKEFNHFATLKASQQQELGDLDLSTLETLKRVKASFKTKGRGFAGVMKRWNFQGGPAAHGSRFHRRPGSIGNREWPGRVQKGRKMAGHYGNELVTCQNEVLSFDKESMVLVLKGSVAGFSGAYGRIRAV